jgi:putative ABC transport system substrate-binding protein
MKNSRVFAILAPVVLIGLILFLNRSKHEPQMVGVIEPMVHIAVSDITKGISDELNQAGAEQFKVIVKNANGDKTVIPQIIAQFKDAGVHVYVPIFTGTAQTVKSSIQDKPIVFAAVTDPVAAGLLANPKTPEGNITGVSDLWPIDAQMDLIKKIMPNIKSMGIVFDPNDPSSSVTMPLVRESASKHGITLLEKPVNSPTGVAEALPVLQGKVDALFTANDTTVTQSFPALVTYAIQNKIPLFAGDYSSVQRGAIAAVGQNYYNVGREAGAIIKELGTGNSVSTLPIRYTKGGDIYLNAKAATMMGVTIPDSVLKAAKEVYESIGEH